MPKPNDPEARLRELQQIRSRVRSDLFSKDGNHGRDALDSLDDLLSLLIRDERLNRTKEPSNAKNPANQ